MNSYLQQARELIEIATKGMSHDELAWHPAEGKWSTANILQHLMLTFSGTAKGLSRVLQAGAPQVRRQTWKDRGMVVVVVNAGYFLVGRQAPKGVVPHGIVPEEAVRVIRS